MERLLNSSRSGHSLFLSVLAAGLFLASQASPQTPASTQTEESTITGTVVSSTRTTLVVRTEDERYYLFVFDRDTVKPRVLARGASVRVVSSPGSEPGVRVASDIRVLSAAAPTAPQGAAAGTEQAVPPQVRRLERGIERQARKYQAGVRAGLALDPELILIGVHAQVGPFFNPDIFFRPNVEFAWGEVTALFALNPEVIYRLPVTARQGRWYPYVGAGPGFSFFHQNFQSNTGGKRIDFGEFHSDTGLNILGGMRARTGMFAELKASIYAKPTPTLRLIIGYNF